jgi:hypothetical protein
MGIDPARPVKPPFSWRRDTASLARRKIAPICVCKGNRHRYSPRRFQEMPEIRQ